MEQLALVSTKSEIGPIMNANEFIDYELEVDLNNPYVPMKADIKGMLDEFVM